MMTKAEIISTLTTDLFGAGDFCFPNDHRKRTLGSIKEALDELETARPLIQAALNPEWPARMYQNNDLTRAALAYREAKAIARRGKGEA